ncbi:myb-like protein Q isoform X1 [Trichogramma pretiosum]|uniref:myb-like protein Q isoform X1 n=1 Tax=Trichogramma pretiosum TaxID=7493 RepID=UPI0006C9675D|nr:myb-like protein Q isoform X1 [Trichogramma pretiosum]
MSSTSSMISSQEEMMMWKEEPLSPSGTAPLDLTAEWFYSDEKPLELEGFYEDAVCCNSPLTRAQIASKWLEELDSAEWIKEEESLNDWLEKKIDLPIFSDIITPECVPNRSAVVYPNIQKPQPQIIPQVAPQYLIVEQPQHVPQQQLQHHQHQIQHHQFHHQQQQQQQQLMQIDETQSLLREFETVLGDVEACHQIQYSPSALTPPQSPPPKIQQKLLVTLQPLQHEQQVPTFNSFYQQQQQQQPRLTESTILNAPVQHQQSQLHQQFNINSLPLNNSSTVQHSLAAGQIGGQWAAGNLSLDSLSQASTDVASVDEELAKVDEYVLSCVEDAIGGSSGNSAASCTSSSSPASPCTSSNGSCMSSEDSNDDPEWSLESAANDQAAASAVRGKPARGAGRKPRASNKPYSRPNAEDKRSRKKEQNKNAATRYRQKKKQEIKMIIGEEQELVNKNEKLKENVKDLEREIGYLKKLMRDLFKAKGMIK